MRPSLQRRLVLLTATTTAMVVALMAAFVWWRMSRALLENIDAVLATEALALSFELDQDDGHVHYDESSGATSKLGGDVLVQVVAGDGRSVFRSPELGHKDLVRPAGQANDKASGFDCTPFADHRYRAVALHVEVPPDEESPTPGASPLEAWILVARPLAPLEQTLASLAWSLAGAAAVALVATLAAAHYVARRGIRPIHRVAHVIGNARPMQPKLDIDTLSVPQELEPIVAKTNELLVRVEHAIMRQRQLTADVAHDLRTPVAGVRTLLDVSLQKERSTAEYAETIATACAALRQLSDLLGDVLILARLDAGVEQPITERCALGDVLRQAIESVQPIALSRNVRIEMDGDPSLVSLVSDRSKLLSIFANLVANAIEHEPPGSSVVVALAEEGAYVAIHVKDHGPGIPSPARERVFDRFFRADPARGGNGHHGLGLPIARGLARLLGGDVRIAASDGSGTDLVVTLPRRPTTATSTTVLARGHRTHNGGTHAPSHRSSS